MKTTIKRSVMRASFALLAAASSALFAQAPGQASAVIQIDCDAACLEGHLQQYMAGLAERDPARVAFAADAVFSENNVTMPIGNDGLWGTASAVELPGLELSDPETGNAAWFGLVQENGNYAYFALRIKVEDGAITEAETVVNRLPDMPKPFGDPEAFQHAPAFTEILAPEERKPRERLIAIADSYFNTVELNDGQVFAPFHEDCGRVENGISTTSGVAAGGGNSAAIAAGCEAQFKLGIYRINKRIRERRYPLVDVERGVVVASGFFDHANTFDRYTLTDGREMNTVLKWPNSITLLEAFKIRNGEIFRIEAVFTYVPYFMPSPFAKPNTDFQTR
ncbi:MAG: hypothetical protein RLZZ227_1144 [Pseudomonadota bacterium]